MASARFDDAGKRFGAVAAVEALSLDVPDGELMVLVGPSGSGKTTALRMLAGLETVTSGHVLIGDRVVDKVSPKDRDVAMVFQDYALYPQMRVYDNLAFGLRRRGLGREEVERRVRRATEALELDALLERKPRQLSGGQQQRVALGRALVRDPAVLLMDEPLSNLDAKLRAQTRGEIRRLQRELATTTVYVTHDQVEAMTMGDRVAVLNHGRLEQVGTPEELYDRPANVFVGGFVGTPAMSFAAVRTAAGGRLEGEGFALELPGAEQLPQAVTLGVRPEHARLWTDAHGLAGPLEGSVSWVEALGRESFVGVEGPGGTTFVLAVPGRSRAQPGDAVRFGLEPAGLRFFDAEHGGAVAVRADVAR
jgi:ABC-type sugar transport system ATPase subunit